VSGLFGIIGIVMFAIEKGDSAVIPIHSWWVGALWYAVAAVLIVIAIWRFEVIARTHWALKITLSVIVVGLIGFNVYSPIMAEYQREHSAQRTDSPKAIDQKATNSPCSNVVGGGDVTINCPPPEDSSATHKPNH